MERQLQNLVESALIFGLPLPSKIELDSCRNEIKLIKVLQSIRFRVKSTSCDVIFQRLWDFVNVIESCVGNWRKTAWKRLDVEEIEQQCKRFSKDIRSLGKLIRMWKPFLYIEKVLRNLVTSLRAITELQNTAIKDRHWLELMKSTGVRNKIIK